MTAVPVYPASFDIEIRLVVIGTKLCVLIGGISLGKLESSPEVYKAVQDMIAHLIEENQKLGLKLP